MKNQKEVQVIGILDVQRRIIPVRGIQVMLDRDLAALYGVETRVLKQAVQRNIGRFPEDFMFQLTKEDCLRSQIVTLNEGRGKHLKYKGLVVTYSDDFHDRFLIIDNTELHGLGSSINSLGRRVTSYATRDAKEIANLLAMVS